MRIDEDVLDPHAVQDDRVRVPVVVRVIDNEFQRAVLEKLGSLEAKIENVGGSRTTRPHEASRGSADVA